MTTATDKKIPLPEFPACKIIYCSFADDGTDKKLLVELRKKFGIVNASSVTCRGIGVLGRVKANPGKLPLARLVKKMHVICPPGQEDEIFEFIFWFANLDKPNKGVVWQQDVTGCSPFELPADIPDEEAGG